MNGVSFKYYPGRIWDTVAIGKVSLMQFIESHKNPKENILRTFKQIEKASAAGDKKKADRLKQEKLYYFTPGAVFKKGKPRRYENIESFTGLAQVDFDDLDSGTAIELKEWLFENYKEFYCVYISPSAKGVKGLIKIPVVSSIDEYKEYYQGIEDEFDWIHGFDPAPKNLALPLFLSYDRDILWRENPEEWTKKGEVQSNDLNNLSSIPPPEHKPVEGGSEVYRSAAYYRRITLEIFKNKIDSIVDNGHPQVRGASLVLGSRIGAGYVSREDAVQFAEHQIRMNQYLSKGTKGYIKTMHWGVKEGMKNPRYYQ